MQAVNDVMCLGPNSVTTPHEEVQTLSSFSLFLSPGCKWKLHIEVLVASREAVSNHKTSGLVPSTSA